MIRTAWLAAKARLGSLLAGGRPPAPRSGLRDPTSQASMAMSSTSSVAPDQPVTNAILDFTSSGELKSQSDELIERWALSSCRTNLQPTFMQFELPPRLELADSGWRRHLQSELLYQIGQAANLDQRDAPLPSKPQAVARTSSHLEPANTEQSCLENFDPERAGLSQPAVGATQSSPIPPLDRSNAANGPGFATDDELDLSLQVQERLAKEASTALSPSPSFVEEASDPTSTDVDSARLGRRDRAQRVPLPHPWVDASLDDWLLLTSPSSEVGFASVSTTSAVPNAVVDDLPKPADPAPASPSVPPIAVTRASLDDHLPPADHSVKDVSALKTSGDGGSSHLDPVALDATTDSVDNLPASDVSSLDRFDLLDTPFIAPSLCPPTLTLSAFTVPSNPGPVAVTDLIPLASAADPSTVSDNPDELLDQSSDRAPHKAVTRQRRIDLVRMKREILYGKSMGDLPLVKHRAEVNHTDYFVYRFQQRDLYPTYEEQYAHALRFWSRLSRTDLRPTYEGHAAFQIRDFEPAAFSKALAQQMAKETGWLRPDHPDLAQSAGFREWNRRSAWTRRVLAEVEHSHLAAVQQRLASTTQQVFPISLHEYDLLADEDRVAGGFPVSLKSLARQLQLQLEVLNSLAQTSRLLRVTGAFDRIQQFMQSIKALTKDLTSDSIEMRLGKEWTAEEITREILEPQFRTWRRSLGDALPMERLHLSLNRIHDDWTEITFASTRKEMVGLAIAAVTNRFEMPRQATPLYVIQGSDETRRSICHLQAEPDAGHYRLRAVEDMREEYEHVGGASDLRCDSVLVPLSSQDAPSGEDIYQPELRDALDLEQGCPSPWTVDASRADDGEPTTRIEARFGKFTFPENPGVGAGQVHDLAAELSSERTFTPQTGTAFERLRRDWIAGKKLLVTETFRRVQYVLASRVSVPTSSKALVFEWEPISRHRAYMSRRVGRRHGGSGRKGGVLWNPKTIRARTLDLRTVNVLFPKRNFDAIISKSQWRHVHPRVVPNRLRRVFRLDPERWIEPRRLNERFRAAIPSQLRHRGAIYVLDKNEEVERSVYLVEDKASSNGQLSSAPTGGAGRKVVLERITCHRTSVSSETIVLEADDPRHKGTHPNRYLPEHMLKDVNHMLCMEDQSW